MSPNGLCVSSFGPIEGRCHDAGMLRSSIIMERMAIYCALYYMYGDPAYPLLRFLIGPAKKGTLSPQEAAFNRTMSRVRIAVEWFFGLILRYWAFVDFKKNMKLYLNQVAKIYMIAAFLTNCLTCARGSNQISRHFRCPLPTLDDYLAEM